MVHQVGSRAAKPARKRVSMHRAGFHLLPRVPVPLACFLGALLVSATALRSADQDKWWPDYAGGPASARYFEATPVLEELYELQSDPLETTNLVNNPAYRDTLRALRARTDELRTQYGGEFSARLWKEPQS